LCVSKKKHPNLASYSLDHLRLGSKKLPEHIQITAKNEVIAFLNISGTIFTSRLKNFNQLTVNHPDYQFHLLRDAREPEITGKVGKEEIAKLNHTKNGKFTIINKSDRLHFEGTHFDEVLKILAPASSSDSDTKAKNSEITLKEAVFSANQRTGISQQLSRIEFITEKLKLIDDLINESKRNKRLTLRAEEIDYQLLVQNLNHKEGKGELHISVFDLSRLQHERQEVVNQMSQLEDEVAVLNNQTIIEVIFSEASKQLAGLE